MSEEKERKLLSVVVSVYNEESVLSLFHKEWERIRLKLTGAQTICEDNGRNGQDGDDSPKLCWDTELIFVNDGSTDGSGAMLSAFAAGDDSVKVIEFSRNFGHEAAMIAGIDHASGDAVICMDADLQHPLSCLPEIVSKLDEGYDVINMVRTVNKGVGRIQNATSRLFYRIVNALSRDVSFEENASDFFAVSRRVADILRTNYREKNRFLRGYVQSVGFKKTTIEYEAAPRAGGKSHYSVRGLVRFSVNAMVCFSDLPIRLGMYAGGFAGLCGLIVLIYTLCTRDGAPSGYATIVVLLCFMFALMFVVIGIIGEYIAIMFAEVKNRPVYLVEKTINLKNGEE